jgi:hypothetical protein
VVCNNTAQKVVCQNCGWPLNMTDAASLQTAQNWAVQMYRKVLRLEAELGRRPTKPTSAMSVQLSEPTELVETLRAEINTLRNGMQLMAAEQDGHSKELESLSDRVQALTNLCQEQKKQAAAAIQQQSIENEKIYSQQKELYKATNRHTQVLNELGAVRPSVSQPLASMPVMAIVEASPGLPLSLTAPPVGGDSHLVTQHDHRSALSDEEEIVAEYNLKSQEIPQAWREQFMNVSIDSEAFGRLRDGDDSNIIFNRDRKGNYLILPRGGYYYLVPNKQRKIISQIYITTKAIYDCGGYNESYREYQLVKPALVAEESTDCWRLSRKGTLRFM